MRLAATAIAVFVTMSAALGCAATPGEGARVPEDVKQANAAGKPERLLERGLAFANAQDYTRAEQYLSAALTAGAPADRVLPALIRACVAENRFRAALTYAEPHLTKTPQDHHLRFVVASLHASVGDTVAALEHLEQITRSRPDYAEVRYAMGVLFRDELQDPGRADEQFREYLRLDPRGPHAEEARGGLLKVITPFQPGSQGRQDGSGGSGGDERGISAGSPMRTLREQPSSLGAAPPLGGEGGAAQEGRPVRVEPPPLNPVQGDGVRDTLGPPPQ
ncbi:tetratricopeptide repeat protein [Chondromyces crocatus]|uniref:Uncharacterized protein n=1 Tax=Chondromyces crocatus TaxID=52 RepID=A0A0K1E751_CHOCO|nr:hypothetical protein [Chondromyces crocatus]AKT36517.1 uncharacterized protein CMC5_006330 [Chondromyces crocatus]